MRRRLYENDDLTVRKFRRLVALTSIDPGALRGDLADRIVLFDLERLRGRAEERRQGHDFHQAWPSLHGRLRPHRGRHRAEPTWSRPTRTSSSALSSTCLHPCARLPLISGQGLRAALKLGAHEVTGLSPQRPARPHGWRAKVT